MREIPFLMVVLGYRVYNKVMNRCIREDCLLKKVKTKSSNLLSIVVSFPTKVVINLLLSRASLDSRILVS